MDVSRLCQRHRGGVTNLPLRKEDGDDENNTAEGKEEGVVIDAKRLCERVFTKGAVPGIREPACEPVKYWEPNSEDTLMREGGAARCSKHSAHAWNCRLRTVGARGGAAEGGTDLTSTLAARLVTSERAEVESAVDSNDRLGVGSLRVKGDRERRRSGRRATEGLHRLHRHGDGKLGGGGARHRRREGRGAGNAGHEELGDHCGKG